MSARAPQVRGRRLPPDRAIARTASETPGDLTDDQLRRGFAVLFPPLPVADPAPRAAVATT